MREDCIACLKSIDPSRTWIRACYGPTIPEGVNWPKTCPLSTFTRVDLVRKMRWSPLLRIFLYQTIRSIFFCHSSLLTYLKIYRPNLSLFTFNAEKRFDAFSLSSLQFFSLRLRRFARNRKFHFYYAADVFLKMWRLDVPNQVLKLIRNTEIFPIVLLAKVLPYAKITSERSFAFVDTSKMSFVYSKIMEPRSL